jgi:hypothetical protein
MRSDGALAPAMAIRHSDVGQKLADLSVSRVAGSSLTSQAFNQALASIRSDAAA